MIGEHNVHGNTIQYNTITFSEHFSCITRAVCSTAQRARIRLC